MNKDKYLELRNELLASAEELVNAGDFEASTAKQEEIKELDNKFESITREMANLNALKEQEVVSLENKSVDVELNNATKLETGVFETMENKQDLMVNAFAKSVLGQELSQAELSNVHYAEDNNVVIPETTMNEIIGLVSEQYPFFGDASKLNITGTVRLPRHKAIVSGDAKGYKEKTATEEEVNTFTEVILKGVDVAKVIEVSFQLEAMSIPAFMDYLKGELVERIGSFLGRQVFVGDASTGEQFEGVIKVLDTEGQSVKYTAGTNIAYTSVTEALSKLASQFQNGAAVYVNNATLWNQLSNIVDGNGRPMFIPTPEAGGVGRLFGLVVKVDGGAPDGVVVIGKPSAGYTVNTNKAITIDSQKDIKARKTIFGAYALMDGKVTDERAFVAIVPEP